MWNELGKKDWLRVYRANVEGKRGKSRSQRRWREEVKELLMDGGLSGKEGMVLAREREAWGSRWKVLVY